MYHGERPIGAAKGKQTNTMALCEPPPLFPSSGNCECWGCNMGTWGHVVWLLYVAGTWYHHVFGSPPPTHSRARMRVSSRDDQDVCLSNAMFPRGRLKRSVCTVQLFGRLAVLEPHTL